MSGDEVAAPGPGPSLAGLIDRLRQFRDARDWSQFHTPKDLAISVSIEAAELLELFQWRKEAEPIDATLVEKVRGEAADVFLYLLLLCDQLGIDLVAAANAKIDHNERRFPAERARGVAKPDDQSADQ
jgi:NTP pyrophosphatase (non-canonical NTP hydrolase)